MSRRPDRGSASLEAAAVFLIAALVVVAVVAAGRGSAVGMSGLVEQAVCTVRTMAPCAASAVPTSGSPGGQADTGDRRDQERGTAGDRGRRGSGSGTDSDGGTGGKPYGGEPLGDPVPGTSVPTPDPPPWRVGDEGAGEYDSETAWPWDHAKKLAVETAANLVAGKWPDAARNLLHYLANDGEPLDQDVDQMLADVPSFARLIDQRRTALGEDAVERARAAGATGPITFPVSTNWTDYYFRDNENQNWFYALGGVNVSQTGQVTVYPPSSPGGSWRYVVTTQVNLRDQYNWDQGKSTDIGPFHVTDETLADLHRKGLAKEYLNRGESSTTAVEGTVP